MEITTRHIKQPTTVTIMQLSGKLDASTYQSLIDAARQEYESGTRQLILDCTNLTFIGSAGLSAFHTVGKIFRGQGFSGLQEGWASFQSLDADREAPQESVKLLNPVPDVKKVLDLVGFNALFETYTDIHQAVASFSRPTHQVNA